MNITVRFKSTPENYTKEEKGIKPNTVRNIDPLDDRIQSLKRKRAKYISIINTETNEIFTREITDYTEWDGKAIISWKHPPNIIEAIAEIEHLQWMTWAKSIMQTENISPERKTRWKKCMIPYNELSEEMKEHDRKWARQVLSTLATTIISDKKQL